MAKYFLNKAHIKTTVKYFFYTVLFLSFAFTAFAQAEKIGGMQEARPPLTQKECADLLETYYKNGTVEVESLFQSAETVAAELDILLTQDKKERNINRQNELLNLYLTYAEIICTAYNFGAINKYGRKVQHIESKIKTFLKSAAFDADFYLNYANYLYTKLPLPGNHLNIILNLPVLYRKTLLFDKTNSESFVKLACWYISAVNPLTSNFNSLIKESESYIDELNDTERFNAYIWYSIFYMKIYETQKGFAYLHKAQALFPEHVLVRKLYENYKKGILSL